MSMAGAAYIFLGVCLFAGLASVVLLIQFLGVARRLRWREPPDAAACPADTRVAVIVPARNEQLDLADALHSLLTQESVELRVCVVNDHSIDRTGAIADEVARDDARVTVIHDPELRPGWLGKANAMQTAAARAQGEFLLFTDADVRHAPRLLATALAEMRQRKLDLLSLFPRLECVTFWEHVIWPIYVAGLARLAGPAVVDEQSREALGVGAFLLVKRSVFDAVGGFESVRGEMLDDVMFATQVKRAGFRVRCYAAPQWLRVRMFKSNRDAFWGPTKNVLSGLRGRYWLAPAALLAWIAIYSGPAAAIVAGLFAERIGLVLFGSGVYAAQCLQLVVARDWLELRWWKAIAFPLCSLSVACCMTRAWLLYMARGAIYWRNRSVRVRG